MFCIIYKVDIAKIQDDEVGDGTTSVTVLCGVLIFKYEYKLYINI